MAHFTPALLLGSLLIAAGCSSNDATSTGSGGGGGGGAMGPTGGGGGANPNGGAGGAGGGPVAGAPEAPKIFVQTGATASSISLAWSLSESPEVAFYNVYRDDKLLAKATATAKAPDGSTVGIYTDDSAARAVAPGFDFPPATYVYSVTAVDAKMRESAPQKDLHYWMYDTDIATNINPTPGNTNPGDNGNMNFADAPGIAGPSGKPSIPGNFIQGNYSCPGSSQVYDDTAGAPEGTPVDFAFSGCGYNQPYSGPPTVPEYALDLGAFNFMLIDFKPGHQGQTLTVGVISRLPQGDVFNLAGVEIGTGKYGPKAEVGTWGSYKIPLADLQVGKGTFEGSIDGDILTVTKVLSGVDVEDGGWVSGGGLDAPIHVDCDGGGENGDCTANLHLTGKGQAGTYQVNPPPAHPITGATFNFQRTNMYKLGILGPDESLYYLNRIGWSVE